MRGVCLPVLLLFFAAAAPVYSQTTTVESAGAYYSDETRTTQIVSTTGTYSNNFLKRRGTDTSITVGHTYKRLQFNETDDLTVKQQLDGQLNVNENSLSLSATQGIQVGTSVSAFGGIGDSPLSKSRYYGLRGSQWWLQETLQTVLEARKTEADVPAIDVLDVDVVRIITPTKIEGENVNLSVTHLTTPSTISRFSTSHTFRNDRPPAQSYSLELRQYIDATKSAVHGGIAHYENVGSITPVTLYGTVVSNSGFAEWHQRLIGKFIIMGGYRHYREQERPRADISPRRQLASDWYYGSLRHRFGKGGWLDSAGEVYVFAGHYVTNVPSTAFIGGLGGRYSF